MGQSDRVVAGTSGSGPTADRYLAVLPTSYRTKPRRHYPVVYLLHGSDSVAEEYLACIRLLELTTRDDVIVVLPQGTPFGFWIDWHNGEQLRESALLEMIGAVDRRFRTIARRSHRAIGGLSMGGYGAMVQAARHPDLYAAAASLSGTLGASDPDPANGHVMWGMTTALALGAFAAPVTREGRAWRAAHDPISLVSRLAGKWLFVSSGNGVACDEDEVTRFAEGDPTGPTLEPLIRRDHQLMTRALDSAGIPHVSRAYSCGAHTFATFQRELEDAWPGLLAAIGANPRG
jgi:S-formylglutathione hydrolase FrmB